MNWYDLHRMRLNFRFENPDKCRSIHSELFMYIVDLWNRLWQKEKIWLPTEMTMQLLGIWSYNTYNKAYEDLVWRWFIKEIKKSKNQYSARIIAISKIDKATDEALDKANMKALDEATDETSDETTDVIYKQLNNLTTNNLTTKQETTPIGVPVKKKSIINKNNKTWAIQIYDKIKEMCVVVDWSLDDCVVLRSKLEKYGGDPVWLLEIMINKMRDTGLNQYYSVSNPWKLADNLGTIVEKLKAEKPQKKSFIF